MNFSSLNINKRTRANSLSSVKNEHISPKRRVLTTKAKSMQKCACAPEGPRSGFCVYFVVWRRRRSLLGSDASKTSKRSLRALEVLCQHPCHNWRFKRNRNFFINERCGRSEPCERRQRDDAKQQSRSDWSQGGSIACLPRAKPWPPEAKQLDSF